MFVLNQITDPVTDETLKKLEEDLAYYDPLNTGFIDVS